MTKRERILTELLDWLSIKGKTHISVLRREIDEGISWQLSHLKRADWVNIEDGYWWLTDRGLNVADDSRAGKYSDISSLLDLSTGEDVNRADRYIKRTTHSYIFELIPGTWVSFSAGVWLGMGDVVTFMEKGVITRQVTVGELRDNERSLYNKISSYHSRTKRFK